MGARVGSLLRGTLQRIVTYTRGVRSTSVITPAADQEAVDYAFPLDTQIGLLTRATCSSGGADAASADGSGGIEPRSR